MAFNIFFSLFSELEVILNAFLLIFYSQTIQILLFMVFFLFISRPLIDGIHLNLSYKKKKPNAIKTSLKFSM